MSSIRPIESVSKREQIVMAIRSAILSGELSPGETIVEGQLAKRFSVSQPSVREALIELEHRGFVQRFPFKGTQVCQLTSQDLQQLLALRIEFESLAVLWAQPRAKGADFDVLRKLATEMHKAAKRLDLSAFYERALEFHETIWRMSGNEYLRQALEKVVVPLFAFYLMKAPREKKHFLHGAAEHSRFADLFATGNAEAAREAFRAIFTAVQNEWIQHLPLSENGQGTTSS